MATIKAYSKAKDGNKKLSKNFTVKEFACTDGTDPIFIATELVEVLQKIRAHFGKTVTITSSKTISTRQKRMSTKSLANTQVSMRSRAKL